MCLFKAHFKSPNYPKRDGTEYPYPFFEDSEPQSYFDLQMVDMDCDSSERPTGR